MANLAALNSKTTTEYSAEYASMLPQGWTKNFEQRGRLQNYFHDKTGRPGGRSIVYKRFQNPNENGNRLHFRTIGELRTMPKKGDEVLRGNETKPKSAGHYLDVDEIRFGTAFDTRSQNHLGALGSTVPETSKELLSDLWNWFNMVAIFMKAKTDITADNYQYPRGVSSINGIRSANTLDMDLVKDAKSKMMWNGGKPTQFRKDRMGNGVSGYLTVFPTFAGNSLKDDPDYIAALQNAWNRGSDNPLFNGDYAPVDGMVLNEVNIWEHSGDGPIGSPLQPIMRLGKAITAGVTAIDITGGGIDNTAGTAENFYSIFFSNAPFWFHAGDLIAAVTDVDRYVAIINPPNAVTDPGKIGFYKYRVNDGHKITVLERLGPSDDVGGIQKDTVGEVEWNGGGDTDNPFFGKTTQVHPNNAFVFECNSAGVPIVFCEHFAAGALYIGHGNPPISRAMEEDDYGRNKGYAVQGYWGICAAQDRKARRAGLVLSPVAADYSAFGYPNNIV